MLSTFGFFEIIVVAAIGFVAWNYYRQVGKFDVNMIILIAVGAYLLYAGVFNTPTSFVD